MVTGNGSIPQLNRGAQVPGARALFHSARDIALILDKTLKPGYGVLKAGTLLSVVAGETDARDYGKCVPYAMTNASAAALGGNAKAVLPVSYSTGATEVYCTVEDAGKFVLGDHIIIGATGETSISLGEVTAIDLTYAGGTMAELTVTGAASAVMTVANDAYIIAAAGASAPFSTAVYVLDQDTDTGTGADAAGSVSSVVASNAVLYKARIDEINGETAGYVTDLGGVVDGRYVILK